MIIGPLETLAAACALLLAGYWLRRRIGLLGRLNVPAPVIGGLAAALAALAARSAGAAPVKFEAVLQQPLMIAFFTCLGFGASLRLLRRGGPQVLLLIGLAAALAVMQGLLGAGVAAAFGLDPLLGVLAGTVTLAGGPATGLAFAPQFEAAGVAGAGSVALAAALAGILTASLLGGPLITWLIAWRKLDPRLAGTAGPADAAAADAPPEVRPHPDPAFAVLKTVTAVAVAMWLGGLVSGAIQSAGATLPAYIGAMLVAAGLRNLDDHTGLIGLPLEAIEVAGTVALSLFLVMAMMTLDLSLLAGLALPLVVNLAAQTLLTAAVTVGPVWWLMGRNYDSAVASGGFAGFMLGTTANAMAIMRALVENYGPAPRAFLVAPLVGAFFIDFTNALIITVFLNLFP